jgi:hypothetical protein
VVSGSYKILMKKQKTQKPKKNKNSQMLPSLYGVSEVEALKELLKSPPALKQRRKEQKNK